MDASELLETITQLIYQAEQGEIDPWDVQVIEVIDRFLELMAPETTTRGYETDLSQSGQAFLSASMLVLFKANTLMQMQASVDEEALLDELPEGEDGVLYPTPRLQLERALRRRSSAMPPPKRRVTLPELIEQLRIMADQLQKVQRKEVDKAPRTRTSTNNVRTMRQALDLAHQENLTEVASELEQLLYRSASELLLEQEWIDLEKLVELWQDTKKPSQVLSGHHESPNSQRVGIFWALLLLSAQSKVELYQEEFYQEIKIRLLTPANTSKAADMSVN